MPIKTILVEDEINAQKALLNMLSFYAPDVDVVNVAGSAAEALDSIRKEQPDLVLMDIHLPDGTGINVARKLDKNAPRIVFITAHNEYALQAIKLSALDYLLKPVRPEDLRAAIERVRESLEIEERLQLQLETCIQNMDNEHNGKKIIINTSKRLMVVKFKELIRCESSGNYTYLHLKDKEPILASRTLKEFEEILSPYGFFRAHQSHLLNLEFVESFDKSGAGSAFLSTNEKIPVSTRRKEGFLKAFTSYNSK
jgi:two-component system LytT family response regulator